MATLSRVPGSGVRPSIALQRQRLGGARSFFASATRQKQRLVILGSGWGGYEVLRAVDKKRWNVIMVSPNNYFNFTPLLASCAVGTLEFRAAIEPVRRYTPAVRSYTAWCDSIDFQHKKLLCTPATLPVHFPGPSPLPAATRTADVHDTATTVGLNSDKFELTYDKLVIAVGAYSQTFDVPGVKEHAHFLKDISDARKIRARVLECFEQANQPTITDADRRKLLNFCIVGGGPTGVEFAAELHDLLHTDMHRHYPTLTAMARINLYDVAPSILGGFDAGLQEYAVTKFKREGIRLLTQHHVERVEQGRMFVTEEGEVYFGLLVWSTGLAPNPLIESIADAKKDERTKRSLLTDAHMNVVMHRTDAPDPDVYALGDAATIAGELLPATAQVANQQAKYVARRLNRLVRAADPAAALKGDKAFEFRNAGSLAYVGDWNAVFDRTRAATGPRAKETQTATGRVAWLLWRSAYFTKTLSVRNKILVPMYWFLNWIFGRDLSRF